RHGHFIGHKGKSPLRLAHIPKHLAAQRLLTRQEELYGPDGRVAEFGFQVWAIASATSCAPAGPGRGMWTASVPPWGASTISASNWLGPGGVGGFLPRAARSNGTPP